MTVLKTSMRNFFAHKGRMALSAIAVLLSVAFVCGTLVFTDTMNTTFDKLFAATASDVTVSHKDASDTMVSVVVVENEKRKVSVEKYREARGQTMMQPVIVPPTFYKDLSKAFLQAVWNRAEQVLREAQLVVFCGYSFPAADMHVKYLLKRAQLNRRSPVTYIVANNHASKAPEEKAAERSRYERFFGREVLYSELSFQEFAAQPATAFALASRPDVDSNHQPSLKESPLC